MSGTGKSTKKIANNRGMTERAGLVMPVARIYRRMRRMKLAKITQRGSAIYTAAVLEYLVAEVLELSGNAARDNKKKRIVPRHVQLAIRNDEELSKLLSDVTLPSAGVLPHINAVLLPRTKAEVEKTLWRNK